MELDPGPAPLRKLIERRAAMDELWTSGKPSSISSDLTVEEGEIFDQALHDDLSWLSALRFLDEAWEITNAWVRDAERVLTDPGKAKALDQKKSIELAIKNIRQGWKAFRVATLTAQTRFIEPRDLMFTDETEQLLKARLEWTDQFIERHRDSFKVGDSSAVPDSDDSQGSPGNEAAITRAEPKRRHSESPASDPFAHAESIRQNLEEVLRAARAFHVIGSGINDYNRKQLEARQLEPDQSQPDEVTRVLNHHQRLRIECLSEFDSKFGALADSRTHLKHAMLSRTQGRERLVEWLSGEPSPRDTLNAAKNSVKHAKERFAPRKTPYPKKIDPKASLDLIGTNISSAVQHFADLARALGLDESPESSTPSREGASKYLSRVLSRRKSTSRTATASSRNPRGAPVATPRRTQVPDSARGSSPFQQRLADARNSHTRLPPKPDLAPSAHDLGKLVAARESGRKGLLAKGKERVDEQGAAEAGTEIRQERREPSAEEGSSTSAARVRSNSLAPTQTKRSAPPSTSVEDAKREASRKTKGLP